MPLKATCRAQADCWWKWSASEGKSRVKDADCQLPEPFAGWGGGSAARILLVGQSPGYDKDEDVPRQGIGASDYFDYYWHRFESQHRASDGRIEKSLKCDKRRRIVHYEQVEDVIGPHRLGVDALYVDAIPWKRADLHPDGGKAALAKLACIAKRRVEAFVPCLQPIGGLRRIIVLGQWGCEAVFGPEFWQPLTFQPQRITFARYDLEVLVIYHPNAQPRVWDVALPAPGLTYKALVRNCLAKHWP